MSVNTFQNLPGGCVGDSQLVCQCGVPHVAARQPTFLSPRPESVYSPARAPQPYFKSKSNLLGDFASTVTDLKGVFCTDA